MTNLVEENTGHITDLMSVGADNLSETDHLIRGILKIARAGINAGFLKLSTTEGSDHRHYLSFMIPYRPSACEIRLVAVAAVDITNLINADENHHTHDVLASVVIANDLYDGVFRRNNADYIAWITELSTAFINSQEIVDAFIATEGDAAAAQFV
jgi:hypothetical protein